MNAYARFLDHKAQLGGDHGFAPSFLPDWLFDFQVHLVEWAVRKGRAALFADCGLGKTPMQLAWAQNIVQRENRPVLILTPLSVSQQTIEEAEKFAIAARRSMDGRASGAHIFVTNYEKLHLFDPDDFAGIVCDESSIIKSFDGARRGAITEFMRRARYRLLCTATAAPNDYQELGTSSEALGELGYMDMLSRFFRSNEDSLHPAFIGAQWRLKPHAERDFWRWMASWARACRRPSDLGFADGDFVLPELVERELLIESPNAAGDLFHAPARSLDEKREDLRATIAARCEAVAARLADADCAVAWCHLNAEGDLLERLLPGAVQIKGGDCDDRKEEVFTAFRAGRIRYLVTKPKIAGFGMNWQHCRRFSYFPTDSFEQYYQAVRRFWRFGQQHDVRGDIIGTTAQVGTLANLKRKARACEAMFERIVAEMSDALHIERASPFVMKPEVPAWL